MAALFVLLFLFVPHSLANCTSVKTKLDKEHSLAMPKETSCFGSVLKHKACIFKNKTAESPSIHPYIMGVYLGMKEANAAGKVLAETSRGNEQVWGITPLAVCRCKPSVVLVFNVSEILKEMYRDDSTSHLILYSRRLHRSPSYRNLELQIEIRNTKIHSIKNSRLTKTWYSFNISKSALPAVNSNCTTIAMTLRLIDSRSHTKLDISKLFDVRRKSSNNGPLLASYININQTALGLFLRPVVGKQVLEAKTERNKNRVERRRRSSAYTTDQCSVHPFSFPLKEVGWLQAWLFYPAVLEVGYCAGSCSSPLQWSENPRVTFYAILKDLYKLKTGNNVLPSVCCVPNDYRRASFLYHNEDTLSSWVRNMANAVVNSCQCL